MLKKIISGGQTGADRAALDAALATGFPAGGSCPAGRMAEDGPIAAPYPLIEIAGGYLERTQRNVEDADGTVVFYHRDLQGGSKQTVAFCIEIGKPYQLIEIASLQIAHAAEQVLAFIDEFAIQVLNVAGPRHSDCPAMYPYVKAVIERVIAQRHRQR